MQAYQNKAALFWRLIVSTVAKFKNMAQFMY